MRQVAGAGPAAEAAGWRMRRRTRPSAGVADDVGQLGLGGMASGWRIRRARGTRTRRRRDRAVLAAAANSRLSLRLSAGPALPRGPRSSNRHRRFRCATLSLRGHGLRPRPRLRPALGPPSLATPSRLCCILRAVRRAHVPARQWAGTGSARDSCKPGCSHRALQGQT